MWVRERPRARGVGEGEAQGAIAGRREREALARDPEFGFGPRTVPVHVGGLQRPQVGHGHHVLEGVVVNVLRDGPLLGGIDSLVVKGRESRRGRCGGKSNLHAYTRLRRVARVTDSALLPPPSGP